MRYLGDGLEGLLNRALQKPCLICGAEATYAAMYVAEREAAERLGAKPGKTRVIFYSLCDGHPQNVETAEQAEKLLEAFLAAESALMIPLEVITEKVAVFEAES